MLAKLIEHADKPSENREIPITKEEFLIGRGADCDLRLGSSTISRHHCMIRVRGREAAIIDLGSSNGTFLNGHRVRSQAPLYDTDELRLGTFVFSFRLGFQDGINWLADPGSDPGAATLKFKDIMRAANEDPLEKERGHPPGEAGGQGDSPGKESG